MEKQSTKRITSRKLDLKVGDYVFYMSKSSRGGFKKGFMYKISRIDKNDIKTDEWPYQFTYTSRGIKFWIKGKSLKKATQQEYIVAKLKGKLYE